MRVLNVFTSIDLKTGGGGAERTYQMSRFLARSGVSCAVLTLDADLPTERVVALAPATLVSLASVWKRFNVPRMNLNTWKTICAMVEKADIVHLMGHWSVLNALVYMAARRSKTPYVVCPVGTLPLFGRSGWLKRLYNAVVGNSIVQDASGWLAVTESEYPQFGRYGIPAPHVTIIPNGVNEEDFPVTDASAFLKKRGIPAAPLILFVGRLNLIKGPDLLLQAFARVQDRLPEFHLGFAGPDGGMLSELREAVAKKGLGGRVHFLGYVDGIDKAAAYRSARLLVVPSRQEAMSIVALEAGVCGVPVLVTDQCGFSDIRIVDPRLEVPATVDGISDGLIRLLHDQSVLEQIAPVWRDFVLRRYVWNSIVPQYINFYRRILGQGA